MDVRMLSGGRIRRGRIECWADQMRLPGQTWGAGKCGTRLLRWSGEHNVKPEMSDPSVGASSRAVMDPGIGAVGASVGEQLSAWGADFEGLEGGRG